jgi:pimeloyl-ACP methyl ester carboxylesterase
MDHLGLKRVHLVGLSLGIWIAAEVAVRDTKRGTANIKPE